MPFYVEEVMYQLTAARPVSLMSALAVIVAALAPREASAHEANALVPDRPGFGDSPQVVAPGFTLLEAGYNFTQDGGQDIHNGPELLLRAGLAPRLEFRVGWGGYNFTGNEGALNTRAGFKLDALDQNGFVPELAVITEIIFPTGDENVASEEIGGEIRFAGGYALSPNMSIGGNANFAERQGMSSDDHFFEFSGSTVYSLALTDRIGSFIEWYTTLPNDPAVEDSQTAQGGFTYIVGSRVQLDVFGGAGLDKAADDYVAGAGIAFVW